MRKFSKSIQRLPQKHGYVRLFTDGSCWPNPGGTGGWSFILVYQDGSERVKKMGGEPNTTNNRMELMAVIQGLLAVKEKSVIELVTDSEYVGKGIALWIEGWKRTGWRQKNSDLWKRLDDLINYHTVYVTCIRGHNGQPENEECDRMAEKARLNYV